MHRRKPRLFLRNERGVAAVEFALILPIMAVLLVCTVETGHAIDQYRKVMLLARTVSDLTAQGDSSSPMAAATMTDILASSSLVLVPFDRSSAKIVVSAMGVYLTTLNTKPFVCSSIGSNATARTAQAKASDLTVPTPFQTTGMRYVLTEVTMPYTPLLGTSMYKLIGRSAAVTFSVSLPWPPRGGAAYNSTYTEVILPSGSSCPSVAT